MVRVRSGIRLGFLSRLNLPLQLPGYGRKLDKKEEGWSRSPEHGFQRRTGGSVHMSVGQGEAEPAKEEGPASIEVLGKLEVFKVVVVRPHHKWLFYSFQQVS